MKLSEMDYITDLMAKSTEDNIETLEEYSIWIKGYEHGYKDRQIEVIEQIERKNSEN